MFENITPRMRERMAYLEERDRVDRADGTTRLARLRQIGPETGRFLAILAANAPPGRLIEIGTSAGYSGLWISLAAALRKEKLVTFEVLPEKCRLARETFGAAGVEGLIDLVEGDALERLGEYRGVAFCFLDAEKEIYEACWNILADRLFPGGLLVADNAISHAAALQPMIDRAMSDERFDGVIVPIGRGELVCRRR